jgi:hypothetical protein
MMTPTTLKRQTMQPCKLLFVAVSLAFAAPCLAQTSQEGQAPQTWPSGQPVAASHQNFLDGLVAVIRAPERLSEQWVKQIFGGTYHGHECAADAPTCDFVDASDDQPEVRLLHFSVKNPASTTIYLGGLYAELQRTPCLRRETVDRYFGKPARRPVSQPAFLILTGEEEIPFQMEYQRLDSPGASGHGYIMLTDGCVTQLRLSFESTNG